MWDIWFMGALTPKFYVALTGTSSLISGLILIFEWWYFRKYGTSFIEQMSLVHLWCGGASPAAPAPATAPAAAPDGSGSCSSSSSDSEGGGGVVRRNPAALLRGAEYARLWTMARRAPLTYYDMNLTAQEHQAWFGCVGEGPGEEALGRAWREREPRARVAAAREALRHAPDLPAALLLLAEEDAPTVLEAERVLRRAWRAAEASLCASAEGAGGAAGASSRGRDTAVLAHVQRRAAACQRRLGRLRPAARTLRALARAGREDTGPLLDVLLAQRLFPDAAGVVARSRHATGVAARYTHALLRARLSAPDARAALLAAIARNPYVPEYLLELRALSLPPEHVARAGRSEALAYAFCHLPHWRACPSALRQLREAWRAAPPPPPPPPEDRALLATDAARRSALAPLLPLLAALVACAALAAAAAHRYPARAHALAARLWGDAPS